jgi:hypothetical protein
MADFLDSCDPGRGEIKQDEQTWNGKPNKDAGNHCQTVPKGKHGILVKDVMFMTMFDLT